MSSSKMSRITGDLPLPSFSNGAAYADLDNDGDMDMIVNNINDEAFVYENKTNAKNKTNANYLQIKFKGNANNINGLGAWVRNLLQQGSKTGLRKLSLSRVSFKY